MNQQAIEQDKQDAARDRQRAYWAAKVWKPAAIDDQGCCVACLRLARQKPKAASSAAPRT
jgi:hypothetical protein